MYWEKLVTADDFIAEASKWLNYNSRPGGGNIFSERVGYTAHGAPWDGAFIDCVAQDTNVYVPSLINSSSGLAEFFWSRRIRNSPRPGDIVFFAFGTDADFGPGHVGIVADVKLWKSDGSFIAIEANVAGLGKMDNRDGVYLMTRWHNDVIAFGRPAFLRRKKKARPGIAPKSETDQLFHEPRPGMDSPVLTGLVFSKIEKLSRTRRRSEEIEIIQRSLAGFGGMRGANPGIWDSATKSAMARFQRRIGYAGNRANGKLDIASLEVLGRITQNFSILP